MDRKHAANTAKWLEDRAGKLAGVYFAQIQTPNSEQATLEFERGASEALENPVAWMKQTTLYVAMMARAEGASGPLPPFEFPEVDVADTSWVVEEDVDRASNLTPKDGDAGKVFIVTSGTYSDYKIVAVFVADRVAAQKYADVHNMGSSSYGAARVEEHEAANEAAAPGGFRPLESVPPVAGVRYRTQIDRRTAAVVYTTADPELLAADHGTVTSVELPMAHLAIVTTKGPAFENERARKSHSDRVGIIRQHIVEETR
jgi:hypothetical protein